MKQAILIHGWPGQEYFNPAFPALSNAHWFPWVQRRLLLKGILAQTPEMPEADRPNYEKWKAMLERFDPDSETLLIGHSCGGGFLIRWLSENAATVGKVVLVAPWLDPEHDVDKSFFDFDIDSNVVSKTQGITIMYSTDDSSDVLESVSTLRSKLKNAEFREFTGKGHFCEEDIGKEFPELLELI
jgi:hypothetical protein